MKISTEYLDRLQNRIDTISNNLANSSTPGFKEQLLAIEEEYDPQDRSKAMAQYGGLPASGNPVLDANEYVGKRFDFSQGSMAPTDNLWDLAINGDGFFQVRTPDGKIGYTRAGDFSTDSMGNLVNNEGMLLEPPLKIPANVTNVSIKSDGTITGVLMEETDDGDWTVSTDNDENGETVIGQISLYKFANPDGLEQAGHNLFLPTQASGDAVVGIAGLDGYGEIKSGMLEKSNTDLVEAMTSMLQAQRAYQIDLRIIKNQDEMMQQAAALRG
jgi:flagellar basal-body rod protein FlgG